MKRFLSFFLVLVTLLTAIPVMQAAAETTAPKAVSEGMGDYRDLYVKQGLVALFTAYESEASATAITSWTPADYYGVKGYESYLAPTAYALTGTWTAKNDSLGTSTNAYFSLKSLVAALGVAKNTAYPNYTVQEVFNLTAAPGTAAVYSKDEAGDYIVENYASLSTSAKATSSTYGAIRMYYGFYEGFKKPSRKNLLNNFLWQIQYHNGSKFTYINNVDIANEYYGGEKAVYYYMKDGVKTALASGSAIYASRYPTSVWEQTVCRTLNTASTTAESIVFTHRVAWQFAPSNLNTGSLTGKGWNFSTTNAATSLDFDTLTVLNVKNINAYSVRVYDRALSDAELDQNHFADLCGFYGADIAELLALSDAAVSYVAGKFVSTALYREKYDASGNETEGYKSAKSAFEAELATAIECAKSAFKIPDTYELLYVKEGLVALFNAHSSTSALGSVTSWTPVDLYGKAGYESYLAPTAYALSGTWTAKNGAYLSAADSYFSLSSLITALAEKTGNNVPTYTVQEVFNFVSSPTGFTASYGKDADGDLIFENYTDANNTSKNQYSTYGSFAMGYLFYSKTHTPANVTFIHNYVLQLQVHNGSGFTYYRNFNTNTDYYAAKGVYYYMADGVKTALNSGKTTYAGVYPSSVWEQTAWRTLDETSTDAENIVIDGKISWQFKMGTPNNGAYTGRGFAFTTSDPVDTAPNPNTLTILNSGNINVYSVRVYNKTFTESEMNRNHFADLCAFYEADVTALLTLSEEALTAISAQMASVPLYKEKYNTNGEETEGYKSAKLAFNSLLAQSVGAVLTDGTTSYIDLYENEGLISLFTAYSAQASEEAVTSWVPVALAGKEGYDSYIEDAASLVGSWKYENNTLYSSYSGAYMDLSALIAKVGTTYSVQTVYQMTTPALANAIIEKRTETADDGSVTIKNYVTNYTSISATNKTYRTSTYGLLTYSMIYAYKKYTSYNRTFFDSWFVQLGGGSTSNNMFLGSSAKTDNGLRSDTFYYTDANGAEQSFTAYHSELPMHVQELSVMRLGDAVVNAETSKVSVNYKLYWQFHPNKRGNSNNLTSNSYNYTASGTADSSTVRVLAGLNANNYSVRVYNCELSAATINQNHFADLCGFYGIAVNGLSLIPQEALAALFDEHATVKLDRAPYDENGNYTDAYYETKLAIQTAVNNAILKELYSVEAAQKSLLAFEGHSFRLSGNYGIRAIFSLSKENLEKLKNEGYTLLNYGAIMAIGTYQGNIYNESADVLTVNAGANGAVSLASGIKGAAFTSSLDPNFKTLSDDESATRFAYTTTYGVDSAADVFSIDMLYRGFAVLKDADGNVSVTYYDMTAAQSAKNSLFDLHKSVIDYYGARYTAEIGMDVYDYIYDVLAKVDAESYNSEARATAKAIAAEYGFDENNVTLTFGAVSDVHVTTGAKGNRLKNMMKVFSNTYNVDAILFAGDVTDRLNNTSFTTSQFITGYKDAALFAEYAVSGNINNVPLIWTLGNHERPNVANSEEFSYTTASGKTYTVAAGTTVTEGFSALFSDTSSAFASATEGAPTGFRRTVVNGYSFYMVDYMFASSETIAWLDAALAADEKANPSQPIFVTAHMPSDNSAQIDCINDCLSNHKNIVYLSGHTHTPMQNHSAISQRDGFLELVLGPGSHGNYGVSGPGYNYCSYEMKQGAVIEVDKNGNVRIRCVDMNYNVEEDGTITTLFTKGGDGDLGTIATNPYVLRSAYFSAPSKAEGMSIAYDSVPRYTTDSRYEEPAFKKDAALSVSNVSQDSISIEIPKADATNYIKYYTITVLDKDGNAVKILDKLASKLSATSPAATLVEKLTVASDFICYAPYDQNYPDPFIYTLPTSYVLTTLDANKNVIATSDRYYTLQAGESYTVCVTAYDDFGNATTALSADFTVPNS